MLRAKQVANPDELLAWQQHVARQYLRQGFVSPDQCKDGCIQDKFDPFSAHFMTTTSGVITGTFRFVPHTGLELPINDIYERLPAHISQRRLFEVTRLTSSTRRELVLGADNGRTPVLLAAVCEAVLYAQQRHMGGFVAVIDPVIFVRFNTTYANGLEPIVGLEPRFYQNGWVIPVYLDCDKFVRSMRENASIQTYLSMA